MCGPHEKRCRSAGMLGKSTPDTSDEGHSGSNPLSGDPQIERSNWLPFYRPYSFASQPFDCFAEDIQFSGIFLIGKNCMGMKKGAVFAFHPAKTAPRNSKWSLKDYHLREAAGCHFTGPIALRHSLSTALPRIFSFPELFCSVIILSYSRSAVKHFRKMFSNFFKSSPRPGSTSFYSYIVEGIGPPSPAGSVRAKDILIQIFPGQLLSKR